MGKYIILTLFMTATLAVATFIFAYYSPINFEKANQPKIETNGIAKDAENKITTSSASASVTSTPSMTAPENKDKTQPKTGEQKTSTPTQSKAPQREPLMWGASVGWKPEDGEIFEKKIGKEMKTRAIFIHWGNENKFPLEVANTLKPEGKTLTIFWEAMDYTNPSDEQKEFSYDSIIGEKWDDYIKEFANDAKEYGGKVILIPFEEMNGNWYPWSGTNNGNSPQKHIKAYRHIHNLFEEVGADNVKFGWSVNNVSIPNIYENQFERYYPGDKYVDYVGVHGFNFDNPWLSFDRLFLPAINRLKIYNKPIIIFSMASAPGPQKASWIRDAFKTIKENEGVVGAIWFNENKERNWLIWSDEASLKAFRDSVSD